MDRGGYIRVCGEQQSDNFNIDATAWEEELAKTYNILVSIEQNIIAYHSLVADYPPEIDSEQ